MTDEYQTDLEVTPDLVKQFKSVMRRINLNNTKISTLNNELNNTKLYKDLCICREKEIDLQTELKEVCLHPKEFVEAKSYYFPGSYLDTAYSNHWNECSLCGEKSKVEIKNHGHYG